MKKNWRNRVAVLLISLLAVLSSCSKSSEHAGHDTYTCPMHPTVIVDKPGACPICGMALVRKSPQTTGIEITDDLAKILKSPNESVVASIKTTKAEYKSVPVRIEAQGIVTYDTRNVFTIPARVGGRLEKVFLKYAFQAVEKGQKIAEIYSPELITAQREFLYLLESDPDNTEMIQSARNKIILLGASEAQVAALIKRKEVLNTFAIHSPYKGYLVADVTSAPTTIASSSPGISSGDGMSSMGSSTASSGTSMGSAGQPSQDNALLREGNYVSTGQTLFRIVNPSSLRVELNLPAAQAVTVKMGTRVQLDFGNEISEATVDLIQPFFTKGEEFVKLRVYTHEQKELRIGQLVKATITDQTQQSQWVPREAVFDLGLNQVVFVKEQGTFKPKKITVGTRGKGWTEVTQGLTSSDEIAANAQYLVDSESFVKAN